MKKIYFCLIAIIFCACVKTSQADASGSEVDEFRDSVAM